MAKKQSSPWRNRIAGYGEESPEQLLAHPENFRIHPSKQQEALKSVLAGIGIIQNVIVNKTTGHVLDGHLRITLAMRNGQKSIPVTYVELTEAEETAALATFDEVSRMATEDKDVLADLLKRSSAIEGLDITLQGIAEMNLLVLDDGVVFDVSAEKEHIACTCTTCGHQHTRLSN